MSKQSSTATKYDKDDPDYNGPSTSKDQNIRQEAKRNVKDKNQVIELSDTDDDDDNDIENQNISLIKTILYPILEEEPETEIAISEAQLEIILQRVFQNNFNHRQSSNVPKVYIEPLNMSNWSFWSKSMKPALKLINL